MHTITRRFEFDSAHRVLGHEGACKNLHGHRYVAEVTVFAESLDSLNRVVDFGVVKDLIGGWINTYWDHNILLHYDDPLAVIWRGLELSESHTPRALASIFGGKEPYIMTTPNIKSNPTAEIIAETLYTVAEWLLQPQRIRVSKVRIYETPNCYADFSR